MKKKIFQEKNNQKLIYKQEILKKKLQKIYNNMKNHRQKIIKRKMKIQKINTNLKSRI